MDALFDLSSSPSTSSPSSSRGVVVLGATGLVGQRLVSLLHAHPLMHVESVVASPRSVGKRYEDAVNWHLPGEIPSSVSSLVVQSCTEVSLLSQNASIAFSALDASIAIDVERSFAEAGVLVVSNTRCFRRDRLVPIVLPYVNPSHLDALTWQKWSGGIVCNANCATTGLVVPLYALHTQFGIDKVFVVTMQACSGAGYPGVSSMDLIDNVIPHINGEQDKIEIESRKILGEWNGETGSFNSLPLAISASVNRVAVQDGHLMSVSVKLACQDVSIDRVKKVFRNFISACHNDNLPSAPSSSHPIYVFDEDKLNRPQPRLDRDIGDGFVVCVGNIRSCNVLDIKFTLLCHNTVLGAAGGAILNAELAIQREYL